MGSGVANGEGLTPRRAKRRDSLIASATAIINRDGVGALDFAKLTKEAGCGRAVVYHYFANLSDIIYQSYRHSCRSAAEILDAAADAATALDGVSGYVTATLSPQAASTAVVSETSMLDPEQQADIEALLLGVYQRIENLLAWGERDGSLRPCNRPVVARAIHSMIAFSRVAGRWAGEGGRVAPTELVDLICHGSARKPDYTFEFREDVAMFAQIDLRNLDKQDIADLRIEQILMAASRMFNRQGVENVSLEALAAELGLTRGAIYHYFGDRQDLLLRCLDRGLALYHAIVDHAERQGRNGLEKSLIVGHLNTQALAGSLQPVMPWFGFESLAHDFQPIYFTKLRGLLDRTSAFQAEGVRDGSRRAGQTTTIIARAGAYNWLPKWIGQIERPSPMALADEMTALFIRGIGQTTSAG